MALDVRADLAKRVVPAGAQRARYLPIAEHGLIGDLHTVALVGTDGTIDWHCCPRFDSPSVFAAILDADRGDLFLVTAGTCSVSRPTATAGAPSSFTPRHTVLITRDRMVA